MKQLFRGLGLVIIAGLISGFESAYTQVPGLEKVRDLSEAFPNSTKDRKIVHRANANTNPERAYPQFGLTEGGLVLLDGEVGSRIICMDSTGAIVWERKAKANTWIGTLNTSTDGKYIYLYHGIDEDQGISEVLDSQGTSRWSRVAVGGYHFSPSGTYLVSEAYTPLSVIETETGNLLWRSEKDSPPYGACALNDNLLFSLAQNSLTLFELKTGKPLWERKPMDKTPELAESPYWNWEMSVATAGDRIAILGRGLKVSSAFVFDTGGKLIWEGKGTVHAQMVGLTPNGKFLAITDFDQQNVLSLLEIDRNKTAWTVDGPFSVNEPFLTDNLIAFRNKLDTRLFLINPNGRLMRHIRMDDKRIVLLDRFPGRRTANPRSQTNHQVLTASPARDGFEFSRETLTVERISE